jgi:hypothetical protein
MTCRCWEVVAVIQEAALLPAVAAEVSATTRLLRIIPISKARMVASRMMIFRFKQGIA